jgi:hypothetical protein
MKMLIIDQDAVLPILMLVLLMWKLRSSNRFIFTLEIAKTL